LLWKDHHEEGNSLTKKEIRIKEGVEEGKKEGKKGRREEGKREGGREDARYWKDLFKNIAYFEILTMTCDLGITMPILQMRELNFRDKQAAKSPHSLQKTESGFEHRLSYFKFW
jgi:hypothetical protein